MVLALLGTGAAAVDDQTNDVDDRDAMLAPRPCGQHRSMTALPSSRPRASLGGSRQGHDERRRNACFGGGLERAVAWKGRTESMQVLVQVFGKSRTGTARARSTQIIKLEYWLINFTSKFEFGLCHSPQLANEQYTIAAATLGKNHSPVKTNQKSTQQESRTPAGGDGGGGDATGVLHFFWRRVVVVRGRRARAVVSATAINY